MSNSKQENRPNVPALRFPGFADEWKKMTINAIANVIGGGTPDTTNTNYWEGDIQWFTPSEVGKSKYVTNSVRQISKLGLIKSSAKILPPASILLSTRATVGECSINIKQCATNQGFQSLVPKEITTADFLYYLIKTRKNELIKKASGSTFLEISANEVRKLPIYIPSKKEQDKIASFLSLLDERIAIQNKIIDKLQSLMRGIVVTHFNRCNKHLITINDLGEAYSVGLLTKDDLSKDGKPCVLYGELFTTYGCVAKKIESRTNKYVQATLSRYGDLLFPSSTTIDAVSLIVPTALKTEGVYVAGDMFGIHIDPQYNCEYISYLLNYIFNRKLSKYAQGSTIIHLHYSDIKNVTIQIPCLEEQNKCAKLLEDVQLKFDNAKLLIFNYQLQRDYLMQNLFI